MVNGQSQIGWDGFLEWASLFHAAPEFEAEERECKLAAVEPLRLSRKHLLDGQAWVPELRSGLTDTHSGNVDFRLADRFLAWVETFPETAGDCLLALWADGELDGPGRIAAFDRLLPSEAASGKGTRLNLAAYLLGAIDPLRWPNYRIRVVEDALELTGTPSPPSDCPLATRYERVLAFYDEIVLRMAERDTKELDRLDAQSLMWSIVKWPKRPPSFTARAVGRAEGVPEGSRRAAQGRPASRQEGQGALASPPGALHPVQQRRDHLRRTGGGPVDVPLRRTGPARRRRVVHLPAERALTDAAGIECRRIRNRVAGPSSTDPAAASSLPTRQ